MIVPSWRLRGKVGGTGTGMPTDRSEASMDCQEPADAPGELDSCDRRMKQRGAKTSVCRAAPVE